jgi:DNA-binding PadR family transcriptional regulator
MEKSSKKIVHKSELKIVPKGMLKKYILALLSKHDLCGYTLMSKIKENTCFWKPSSGTLYPLLKNMKDDKLIDEKNDKNKKIYCLTKKGKQTIHDEKISTDPKKLNLEIHSGLITSLSLLLDIDKEILENKLFNNIEKIKFKPELKKIIIELARANNKDHIDQVVKILKETVEKLQKIK